MSIPEHVAPGATAGSVDVVQGTPTGIPAEPGQRLSLRRWRGLCEAGAADRSTLVETASGVFECAIEGEGEPVVILHGMGGGYDHGLWIGQRLGLGSHQVVALSRPGYLRTPVDSGPTPERLADGVRDLLDALGIQCAALIGSSAGGMGALRFALRHPDRCSGVVMLSGVSRQIWAARLVRNVPLTAASDLSNWSLERYPRLGACLHPFFWGRLVRGWRGRTRSMPSRQLRQEFIRMLRTTSPAAGRAAGRALDLHNVSRFPRAPTGSAGVPALVIHARADRAVPFSHALTSLRWLPRAELLSLAGGGHLLPLTRPDLAGPINRFLSGLQQ